MPTGLDWDRDGDHDEFDVRWQELHDNGQQVGEALRTQLLSGNAVAEVLEDIQEYFDDDPSNDSFHDGGNGSGHQNPTGVGTNSPFGPFLFEFAGVTLIYDAGSFYDLDGSGFGGFWGGGGGGDGGVLPF